MLNLSRVLLVLCAAAFLTTGTSLAQSPPQSAPQNKCGQTAKGCHKNQPKPQSKPQNKCAQTPKGCHKNQSKPPAGTPPLSLPR